MENILYYILGGILLIAILIAVIVASVAATGKIYEKKKAIKYYKMELERSDDEEDRLFWKEKLRRERLTSIPLICWFIK